MIHLTRGSRWPARHRPYMTRFAGRRLKVMLKSQKVKNWVQISWSLKIIIQFWIPSISHFLLHMNGSSPAKIFDRPRKSLHGYMCVSVNVRFFPTVSLGPSLHVHLRLSSMRSHHLKFFSLSPILSFCFLAISSSQSLPDLHPLSLSQWSFLSPLMSAHTRVCASKKSLSPCNTFTRSLPLVACFSRLSPFGRWPFTLPPFKF